MYLEALRAAGGPRIGWDEAWDSYREHLVPGIHGALVPNVVQSSENVVTMATRFIAAIDDHSSISAVLDASRLSSRLRLLRRVSSLVRGDLLRLPQVLDAAGGRSTRLARSARPRTRHRGAKAQAN